MAQGIDETPSSAKDAIFFIRRTPVLAIIPPETKKTLERLTNISDCHIAVISGRNLEDLQVTHIMKVNVHLHFYK